MSYLLTWRRMAQVCLLATISSSVYAVDGVVLINQGSAAAGSVTPGDAPGFPITISQSGSYKLSSDLIVPDANTTAIEITAGFVTIDMNGFSIIGPAVCSGHPVACVSTGSGVGIIARAGAKQVKVFNGTIHGMGGNGIDIGNSDVVDNLLGPGFIPANIVNVHADSNGGTGISVAGIVTGSVATMNGSSGIAAVTVRDSIAINNGQFGIAVSNGVASGNMVLENLFGLFASRGTLTGNTANSNQTGIGATCPSSIVGNTAIANSTGLQLSDGTCTLANNAAN
jgi:hypothetical protein